MASNEPDDAREAPPTERRAFLSSFSSLAVAGGIAAASGALSFLGRVIDATAAADVEETGWVTVTGVAELNADDSLVYRTPSGRRVVIARRGPDAAGAPVVAVSGTCPHLGGRVRWEIAHDRFVCPCPDGTFDPSGAAMGGPGLPSLFRYRLRVEGEELQIELPAADLALGSGAVIPSPDRAGSGHDPCLDGVRTEPVPSTPRPGAPDAAPRKGNDHETT